MKTILCYGDSNTWGFMPKAQAPEVIANNRYPWGVRWTSLLQIALGQDYHVAECGVNGRTTMFDCPLAEYRNGLKDIDVCIQSQHPVDLVIIMLGTNDTKFFFGMNAFMIAKGAERIIERIRQGGYGPNGKCPEILLMAPIRLHPDMMNRGSDGEFGEYSLKVDAQLNKYLGETAKTLGTHYLDAGAYVTADPADCIHMNEEGHAILAEKVIEKVKEILG